MSIVQLLSINFLNNDYNHTIDFVDEDTQIAFFDNYVTLTQELPTTDDYVYVRENRFIDVDANKSILDGINYLRFNNENKWWYAFITSKDYLNEDTTRIHFEIDVMQTFMFDYTLKESFISRQHEDRWNSNNKPIFNLKQEDIDLGSDYIKTQDVLVNDTLNTNLRITCALIVSTKPIETSGTIVTGSTGPTQAMSDPLFYYIVPIANRPTNNNVYDSTNRMMSLSKIVYDMTRTDVSDGTFLTQQSNYSNIVSINILPYMPFDYGFTISGNDVTLNTSGISKVGVTTAGMDTPSTIETRYIYRLASTTLKDSLYTIDFSVLLDIPAPVKTLSTNKTQAQETKLYTAPYVYITLDDNQTIPLKIKPQFIDNLSTSIKFNQGISNMPNTRYYINGYKGDVGSDNTLINNNVNNINLITSKLADYLNDRQASATTGLAVNTAIDVGTNIVRTGIGLGMGNPFAISNAISGVSSTAKNILNELYHRQDLVLGSPNYKDKSNNVYAYIQQFISNAGLHIKKYDIASAFKQVAYDLFYHYGYACRDFLVPNVRSRYYFNYIQSPDMCIDTGIDNEYINKIKSIFRDGITIWHYRDANTWGGIENYQYENVEMSLLGV